MGSWYQSTIPCIDKPNPLLCIVGRSAWEEQVHGGRMVRSASPKISWQWVPKNSFFVL